MDRFYAVVHHEVGSAWGIHFPDVPGCFAAADDERDIMSAAQEALSLYFADESEIPEPRCHADVLADPEVKAELKAGAFLMQVAVIQSSKKQRFNFMIERDIAKAIDRAATASGSTKSDYVADAIADRLRREGAVHTRRVASYAASGSTGGKVSRSPTVRKDKSASRAEKATAASALTQTKSKESTGKAVAASAAKIMRDPKASAAAKSVAASALTQKSKK